MLATAIEIVTLGQDPRRLKNAWFIQSQVPHSQIVNGVEGGDAAIDTFARLGIHIHRKYPTYKRSEPLWRGKFGHWASFLQRSEAASNRTFSIVMEDDIRFNLTKLTTLVRVLNSIEDWTVKPMFMRASHYDACVVFNGARMKDFLKQVRKTGIENPTDVYVKLHRLGKWVAPVYFDTHRWPSVIKQTQTWNSTGYINAMIDEAASRRKSLNR